MTRNRTDQVSLAAIRALGRGLSVDARAPGFTLVELMVALTGGLFVSLVVFALARDGSRFYHRESRVAEATLGSVVGFERLRNDIARAGYLSTPNLAADASYCGTVAQLANFPQLQQLASIQITADDVAATNPILASATPPITPNSILLGGAYDSIERYDTVAVSLVNNRYEVRMQTLRGALFRLGFSALATSAQSALLAQLFPAGRAVRLFSMDSGTFQIGVISSTGFDTNGAPTIFLAPDPPLILRDAAGGRCNASTNQQINVVNLIRYTLRRVMGNTADFQAYQQLFDTTGNLPGESNRLELVREELNANGSVVAGSQEVVAEYAVDLRFALTRIVNPGSNNPSLVTDAFDSTNVVTFGGPVVAANPTAQPQNIRSVRARLSVRSREADRDANIDTSGGDIAPGLYRIGLGDKGTAPFARVRTIQADILIGNQSN